VWLQFLRVLKERHKKVHEGGVGTKFSAGHPCLEQPVMAPCREGQAGLKGERGVGTGCQGTVRSTACVGTGVLKVWKHEATNHQHYHVQTWDTIPIPTTVHLLPTKKKVTQAGSG
jgi:hypothetical protein